MESRSKPTLSHAALLRQALQGAVFPLSRDQLVRVARENAAPSEILTALSGLPRGEFRSLEAVAFALEGDAQDRVRAQQDAERSEG